MKKIPLGKLSFQEVLYLTRFTVVVAISVCLFIVFLMGLLVVLKYISTNLFGSTKFALIILWLPLFVLYVGKKLTHKTAKK